VSIQPDRTCPRTPSGSSHQLVKVLVSPGVGIAGREFLKGQGYRVVLAPNRGALRAEISDADALIATVEHCSPQLLRSARTLKAIAVCDAEVGELDLGIARSLGIQVIPASHLITKLVAEQTLALMFACARSGTAARPRSGSGGRVPGERSSVTQLTGKTLGLIGAGPVGIEVARMCRAALGTRVVAYHPVPAEASKHSGIAMVASPREVLLESDIVAVQLAATTTSEGLVDADLLAACRPGAILVSTAGAGVVCEDALYSALLHGPLAAAAIDGFAGWAPQRSRLFSLPNFLATSVPARTTREALDTVSISVARAIHAALSRPSHNSPPRRLDTLAS
jgi:phosphoglycerate dehydrogenase-like enzyme